MCGSSLGLTRSLGCRKQFAVISGCRCKDVLIMSKNFIPQSCICHGDTMKFSIHLYVVVGLVLFPVHIWTLNKGLDSGFPNLVRCCKNLAMQKSNLLSEGHNSTYRGYTGLMHLVFTISETLICPNYRIAVNAWIGPNFAEVSFPSTTRSSSERTFGKKCGLLWMTELREISICNMQARAWINQEYTGISNSKEVNKLRINMNKYNKWNTPHVDCKCKRDKHGHAKLMAI